MLEKWYLLVMKYYLLLKTHFSNEILFDIKSIFNNEILFVAKSVFSNEILFVLFV